MHNNVEGNVSGSKSSCSIGGHALALPVSPTRAHSFLLFKTLVPIRFLNEETERKKEGKHEREEETN